jgi:AcrR family transcriptional regulator
MVQKSSVSSDLADAKPKQRGRPRSFLPEEALRKVLETFWSKGYSATSLDDLSQATGLNRPSLYAAFGDKRALYRTVLTHYWQLSVEAMDAEFAHQGPLEEALVRIYDRALTFYFPKTGTPRGCFAIGTAVTEAVENAEIRSVLAEGLVSLDQRFEARIAAAQQDGELSPAANCRALAMMASAALHSIAIRARAGTTRTELAAFGRQAARLICALSGNPHRV